MHNKTGTRMLKVMKNTNGFIHIRPFFPFFFKPKVTFLLLQQKRFRDTLPRFCVRACGLRSHKVWFQTNISENSSCPMCVHLLDDEVHFLFQCPAYLREKYVSTESVSQPNWSNVRNILACENEPKTINLSKYLTFGLDIRKKKLELECFFFSKRFELYLFLMCGHDHCG